MTKENKEKIRKILNWLVQDCQDMDRKLTLVNFSIDLSLSAIVEIVKSERTNY